MTSERRGHPPAPALASLSVDDRLRTGAPGGSARARLLILAAALLFSTGGAAIKGTSLGSWQVACFRSATAAVMLAIALPHARAISWRIALAGCAYASTLISFVAANKLTTAAHSVFLQSVAPLYLLLLGPLLLKEPVRRRDLPFLLVIGSGMTLLLADPLQPAGTAPDPARGNVVAVASGLCWALTLAGLRWLERRGEAGGAAAAALTGNVLASLATLPFALPVVGSGPVDWLVIAWLGIFQVGLAYVCLTRGIAHVPAVEASLLLLLEPAINPAWAWAVHGETVGLSSMLGAALILLATTTRTLMMRD